MESFTHDAIEDHQSHQSQKPLCAYVFFILHISHVYGRLKLNFDFVETEAWLRKPVMPFIETFAYILMDSFAWPQLRNSRSQMACACGFWTEPPKADRANPGSTWPF